MATPRGTVSLERALSKLGLATRTEARALIRDGHVRIDGRLVRNPGAPFTPERITVTIDGRERTRPAPVTIALHKPRGIVTTRRDPEGRRTVYDLIKDLDVHVIPVGRLDYATSGLLLLTNDTRFADWLTDPSNAVVRVYLATIRGRVAEQDVKAMTSGVTSRGETLRAERVTLRKASDRESLLVVELVEGRNREVRRLCAAVGHPVTRLRRVQIGGLTLGGLAPGAWRRVPDDELARAFPQRISTRKLRRASLAE
jgi:23S rRNA pseudouridine2605 synthase